MCNKECLKCQEPVCILDKHKQKTRADRKQYQHEYYMSRKIGRKYTCKNCGKEIHGQAYRLGKKMYCGINCMMCRLWDENEKRMQIINI